MKRVAIAFVIAFVVSISAFAVMQKITSFSGTAPGRGTLTVDHEKSKIKSVYINLKENGEARHHSLYRLAIVRARAVVTAR
jgi:hypothetical protein